MVNNASPTKPNNLVQTIERVSLILEMVGQNPQGVGIRDLSAGLKLAKGTVHRLLSSLSYFGYIRQDPETKNYFLGLKLMELSTHLGNQLDFRKVAEPILRGLAERTKQTAHMVIYGRDEVVYIEKIETEQPAGGLKMAFAGRFAQSRAQQCGGEDAAFLLFGGGRGGLSCGEGAAPAYGQYDHRSEGFPGALKIVRSQGYSMDDEENEKGIRCVGAPIFDGRGRPVAAISVSGPVFQMTKKFVQDVVRKEVTEAAAEISRRLGFKG